DRNRDEHDEQEGNQQPEPARTSRSGDAKATAPTKENLNADEDPHAEHKRQPRPCRSGRRRPDEKRHTQALRRCSPPCFGCHPFADSATVSVERLEHGCRVTLILELAFHAVESIT